MATVQRIRVIDSHTGGEPTRVVVAGGPDLGAETVRAPRLPLVGREREEILAIIRRAVQTRPTR